jgi:hypothetical protein
VAESGLGHHILFEAPVGSKAMRPIGLLLLMALSLIPRAASAETVDGSGALALAALVGENSPLLGPPAKKLLAKFLDGETKVSSTGQIISVDVDKLTCKASNVDITLHSCELVFGTRTATLTGRAPHELYATLVEVGVPPDAGAGSVFEAVSKLDCKIDPNAVIENASGGAHCNYAAPQ